MICNYLIKYVVQVSDSFSSLSFFGGSNNAGIMATPFGLSKDNIELQFATNHLGTFI